MLEKVERKTDRDGNLYPKAFNCLSLLPENFICDNQKRHPASIYSDSIQEIMESFNAVLNQIDQISTNLFNAEENLDDSLEKLPNLQKRLLYALQSHIDHCYGILKLISPYDGDVQKQSAADWLKEIKHPAYNQFHSTINEYRKPLALIVNKLKHEGGSKLLPTMIYSKEYDTAKYTVKKGIQIFPKNTCIVGYFLEGMQPNRHIGPDCEVHPDGISAISLNRNLRYHFANVYRIGHYLRGAIATTVTQLHKKKLPYDAPVNVPTSQYYIESIAERISKLPPLFFENEYSEKTPNIKFHRNNKNAVLTLEFSGSQYMPWVGEFIRYNQIKLDGFCRNYQPPYR